MKTLNIHLTEEMIQELCDRRTFSKGEDYVDHVYDLKVLGSTLYASVQGSQPKPYKVRIELIHADNPSWEEATCSCPVEFFPCKHIVATLLKFVREGVIFLAPPLKEMIESLDEKRAKNLLLKVAERYPEVIEEIQIAVIHLKGESPSAPLFNTDAISKRMAYLLNENQAHEDWEQEELWIKKKKEILELAEEIAIPFLERGEGNHALKVLEAIMDPLIKNADLFIGGLEEEETYGELIESLELLWLEAFLAASLSKQERLFWRKRFIEWEREGEISDFSAVKRFLQRGWDDPLLKAVLNGEADFEEEEGHEEEKINDKLAFAAFRFFKRRQELEKCLLLAHFALMDEEYAELLIEMKRYEEAEMFIKRNIHREAVLLKLSRKLDEAKERRLALEIIRRFLPAHPSQGKVSLHLLKWMRELAFEMNEKQIGIQASLVLMNQAPTLEDYLALQKGAGEEWSAIQSSLLQAFQTHATASTRHEIIRILLHEGKIEEAIRLAKTGSFPDALIEAALEKYPEWALKECEERALAAIKKGTPAYLEVLAWLEKGYQAARQIQQVDHWNKKIEWLLRQHSHKYNLVRKLRELLAQHSF